MMKEMRAGDIRKGDVIKADIGAFIEPLHDGTVYFFAAQPTSRLIHDKLADMLMTICEVNFENGEIINVMTAELGKISIWPNGVNSKVYLQKRI